MAGILLVCSANVCRSPLAELTLREALEPLEGFRKLEVASAGIAAREAAGVCDDVVQLDASVAWRERAQRHRSRPLDPDDVHAAELVLTASREVRAAVVAAAPERRRHVFTLLEAVWLGEGFVHDPGRRGGEALAAFQQHIDGLRGLRPAPSARRSRWFSRPAHAFDIEDGHVIGRSAHRATLATSRHAASALAVLLVGAPARAES